MAATHGWAVLSPAWELALWQAVFVLATGPLVWAIVVWRCSLVFHDFDKVSTVFIHLLPPLWAHCARFEVRERVRVACAWRGAWRVACAWRVAREFTIRRPSC